MDKKKMVVEGRSSVVAAGEQGIVAEENRGLARIPSHIDKVRRYPPGPGLDIEVFGLSQNSTTGRACTASNQDLIRAWQINSRVTVT